MSPPPPFPGLDLIPRGREGPCPFPRDFVYGSVCPSLSCCSCSGSAFTPAAFPGGLPRMIGAAFPEVPWTHVSLPKTAGVACSERLTHVGIIEYQKLGCKLRLANFKALGCLG